MKRENQKNELMPNWLKTKLSAIKNDAGSETREVLAVYKSSEMEWKFFLTSAVEKENGEWNLDGFVRAEDCEEWFSTSTDELEICDGITVEDCTDMLIDSEGRLTDRWRLMPAAAAESMPKLYATDGMKQREVQLVIYHMFSRWTWYVVEGERQEDGDWMLFCWCKSGLGEDCDEWGYTTLKQFEGIPYIQSYIPSETLVIDNQGNILN